MFLERKIHRKKHLCQSLFLIKLQSPACNFIKKGTLTQVFYVNIGKFLRATLYRTNPDDCFCKSRQGLSMHTAWAHPNSTGIDKSFAASNIGKTRAKKSTKITGDNVRSKEIETVNIENNNENDLTQNQGFSGEPSSKKKRKQYDFVFKMDVTGQLEDENVLAKLYFITELTNQWLLLG